MKEVDELKGEIVSSKKEYKNINLKKYDLLISIIFLIFGAVLTTNPGNIVKFISYIIGGILIIIGAIKIILFFNTKKKYDIIKIQDIVSGIVLCVLGLVACIWGNTVVTFIRIIVGAWILYSGISNLIYYIKLGNKLNIKSPLLITSLIMILIGLCTIMIKYIEFRVLGVMIILYSIADIIRYIFNQK